MSVNNQIISIDNIQNRIYTIRGLQVILDKDLAFYYEVKAIRLREQVKRNPKRFPSDFMFRLTDSEVEFMVSQNAIPSKKHLGGSLPYVFTEQGVTNLSAVLTSDKAIEINNQIARAFVEMRKFLFENASIFNRLDNIEQKQLSYRIKTDEKFEQIFKAIEDKSIKTKQGIFYDGQVFDAYIFISDLIKSANKSILLIDNYIDETVLRLFTKRNKNVPVSIFSKNITKILLQDLEKHNAQYPKIELKKFTKAHDRFLIIDEITVYHFGASLKDLGKRWFAFSKMDMEALEMIAKLNDDN